MTHRPSPPPLARRSLPGTAIVVSLIRHNPDFIVPDLKTDEHFMQKAIKVATQDGADPALSPIGCVIVLGSDIIAADRNHVADKHDATAHAEIEAVRTAGRGFDAPRAVN
ncbi:deaminase [Bradyrhizobium ontarionense]|uniref:Deaminase n=1 Tax=Bradyrhizobium ontarionense TaxID=2898149 RepID=A0ABY3RCW3_9BRAD|nr:deaminase [Bradyrhizobium sp. A19]UFZ05076.1 deaminase [Bradyrhizobium sp. A19]